MKIFTKLLIFIILINVVIFQKISAETEIKIGLLVPLSGKNSEIGKSIIKSIRIGINRIGDSSIKIIPKDTRSNPETTLREAKKLTEEMSICK